MSMVVGAAAGSATPGEWRVELLPDGRLSIRFPIAGSAKGHASKMERRRLGVIHCQHSECDCRHQCARAEVFGESAAALLRQRLLGHHALAIKKAETSVDAEASGLTRDINNPGVKKEELAVQVENLQKILRNRCST